LGVAGAPKAAAPLTRLRRICLALPDAVEKADDCAQQNR
jgi:hypothetical protein